MKTNAQHYPWTAMLIACLLQACSAEDPQTTDSADQAKGKAMQNVFDEPENLRVIFHPRPDNRPDDTHDITIKVDDDVSLAGRLFISDSESPLVLFFHGNGEIASDYNDIAGFYGQLGLSLLIVDFRGYGKSEGTPTVTTLLSDARQIFDQLPAFLDANKLKPARLYVMGRSLGSASALEIATHAGNGIAGLIIESGFAYPAQLVERLGGRVGDVKDETGSDGALGALGKIATVSAPTLIIHGERDWIIPITDGQALHYHSGATNKTLVQVPGAGHNDLLWRGQQQYFDALKAFTAP
ncbi:MAG: pimeloyl-ACP methyl ester carboxylesterase [Kiritimatiellia bacterium]|jgi:pimeloyl-ACP methyl ester carboxylesterase